MPYTLHNLILAALGFLSFGELPDDERPPKHIWLDGDRMREWWAEVKRLREAEAGGHGDQAGMTKNPLMERLKIVGPDG